MTLKVKLPGFSNDDGQVELGGGEAESDQDQGVSVGVPTGYWREPDGCAPNVERILSR